MGMYNAIIPDELLFPLGVFKERLSQSALYSPPRARCPTPRRAAVHDWLVKKGMAFHFGDDRRPTHRSTRCSTSAACTSPPPGSPTTSAAT